MCIIAVIPKKTIPPKEETLRKCWDSNPHRAGFMYVTKEGIQIHKFKKFKDFYRSFSKFHIDHGDKSPFVIHMRYATHGAVNKENTHPFRVSDKVAFCHNGVIHKHKKEATDKKSDTRVFNETILAELDDDALLYNPSISKLLGDYIGKSKLVFLNTKGQANIVNADLGDWVDGVWYSNEYYKTPRVWKKKVDASSAGWYGNPYADGYSDYDWRRDLTGQNRSPVTPFRKEIKTSDKCTNCRKESGVYHSVYMTADGWDYYTHNIVCHACYSKFRIDHDFKLNEYPTTCDLCISPLKRDEKVTVFDLDDTSINWKTHEKCVEDMVGCIIETSTLALSLDKLSEILWEKRGDT